MKRQINATAVAALTAICVSMAGLSACSAPHKESAGEESQTQTEAAEIPNPMKPVEGTEEFASMDIYMAVPEGAQETEYYLINNEVAEIIFTLDEVKYSFRASNTAEDFAGIFERFTDEVLTAEESDGSDTLTAQIKTTQSGGRLASWEREDTRYTLYTASNVSDEEIVSLTKTLLEESHQP